MAATQTSLTVTARAVDQASGPLGDVAKSVKALPEQFSKASAALSVIGGATQEMGGQVAGAAGKLSGLAAMVATGGPVGIALAGLSAAVAVGTTIWETYSETAKQAESAARGLEAAFAAQTARIVDATKAADDAEKALANFGKTANEIKVADLEQKMSTFSGALTRNADEIERLEARSRELTQTVESLTGIHSRSADAAREAAAAELETVNAVLEATRRGNDAAQQQFDAAQRQSEALRGLAAAEKADEDAKKRKTDATKKAADDLRELNRVIQEAIQKETEYGKKVGERLAANFSMASDHYARVADLTEKDARWQEQQQEKQLQADEKSFADRKRMADQYANTLVSGIGGAFDDMISGSKKADQAFADLFKNLGKMVLTQAATYVVAKGIEMAIDKAAANSKLAQDTSTAASGALSAHSNIPFVGIAIGLAAAAAIIAAIFSFKKFATGGVVTGGVPGMDSVPALLMPGERVLTVGENRAYESGGRGGGGGITINVDARPGDMGMPDRMQRERYARNLSRNLNEAARNGYLRLGRA